MTAFDQTGAVVTGASSGIGRAIAIALAQSGVQQIAVHYCQNWAGAEETATKVRDCGAACNIIQADLAEVEDRIGLVQSAFDQLGIIQTWINNAGVDVLTGDEAQLDFGGKLRHLLEVDVVGTIDVSRMVGDRLKSQTGATPPSMTFIGWDQALRGMEGDAGQMFGATKAAVMAFAASLAQSLAPRVRVNTIAPGWIKTAWGESAGDYWDQRAHSQSLMNRWGTPDDVARAALYLADPANTFLTGQTIEVNGGWNRHFMES